MVFSDQLLVRAPVLLVSISYENGSLLQNSQDMVRKKLFPVRTRTLIQVVQPVVRHCTD